MQEALLTLTILILAWSVFYIIVVLFRLDRYGLEVHPLYALYKSTRLNSFLESLGQRAPRLWRVFGNVGVVTSVGQVAFITYLMFLNLYRFLYVPEKASPVMPLIPGVTVRLESLPWFFAAAGFVILLHELSHGVQCTVEGVSIKSSAILIAVVTFGGAVEPDEEEMKTMSTMSKMRILAAGSMTNLATGLILIAVFIVLGDLLPIGVFIFLQWVYFLSINLALLNMLPVFPLDGGQMMGALVASMKWGGTVIQRVTSYGFLALVGSNLILSLVRFGLIPL